MYDEATILDCARTIRSYLPRLLGDEARALELDADLADLIDRGERNEPVSALITDVLTKHPETKLWMRKYLQSEDMTIRLIMLRGYVGPEGDPDPIPVRKYVCPIACDTIWFRQSVGEEIPICQTKGHKVRLVPVEEATC